MNNVNFATLIPNFLNSKSHVHFITLSGFNGSGRHTIANMLKSQIEANDLADVEILSLYDGIYETVNNACGFTKPMYMNRDRTEFVPEFWKEAFGKKASYENVFTRFLNGFLSVNPNIFTYGLENKVSEALRKQRKHKDIVFIIPDISQNRDMCMLRRFENEGYNVVRCIVFRLNAMPEWVLLVPDFNKSEDMKKIVDENYDVNWLMHEWSSYSHNYQVIMTNDGTLEDLEGAVKKIVSRVFNSKTSKSKR